MNATKIDALLVTAELNVTYLTGFTGDSSYLLVWGERELLITDGRYTQVAGGELKEGELVVVGLVTAKADASAGRNPMAPAVPGGPGGGRRF